MHGLIIRSIQCFLRETYGPETWAAIATAAEIEEDNFEALLTYEDWVADAILTAAAQQLASPKEMVLEDLGTFLVSHPSMAAPRRLLRFGGENFVELLFSLDELQDRVRLAVPELQFPQLELRDHSSRNFTLLVTSPIQGFGHALIGLLRAMADDYGTLAILDHHGRHDGVETITIELVEICYSEGREFFLAERL